MAVYVDSPKHALGRMVMCHMMADSTAELLAMADRLGMKREWIQAAGTAQEHFDVPKGRRARAVALGAREVDSRDLVRMVRARRLAAAGTESP